MSLLVSRDTNQLVFVYKYALHAAIGWELDRAGLWLVC